MPLFFITFTESDQPPLELDVEHEKLTWDLLVHRIIQSTPAICIELPIVLYYKLDNSIKLLKSQIQLQELLDRNKHSKPMYLFDTKEMIDKPAFVEGTSSLPPPPAYSEVSAFNRLGQLIDSHKKIISSSPHLSRCVGILASAIAMDTSNKDFDKEFKALEKVIESRKDDFRTYTHKEKATIDQQQKEALNSVFDRYRHGKRGGKRGGFGHHHVEEHNSHHRGRGDPFRGGRDHFHHHGGGGPSELFYSLANKDEKKKHRKAQACFRGRDGGSSSEESLSADEIEALQTKMRNTHIHEYSEKIRHHHHHPRNRRDGGRGGDKGSHLAGFGLF